MFATPVLAKQAIARRPKSVDCLFHHTIHLVLAVQRGHSDWVDSAVTGEIDDFGTLARSRDPRFNPIEPKILRPGPKLYSGIPEITFTAEEMVQRFVRKRS